MVRLVRFSIRIRARISIQFRPRAGTRARFTFIVSVLGLVL
jgi:hypothetical protein